MVSGRPLERTLIMTRSEPPLGRLVVGGVLLDLLQKRQPSFLFQIGSKKGKGRSLTKGAPTDMHRYPTNRTVRGIYRGFTHVAPCNSTNQPVPHYAEFSILWNNHPHSMSFAEAGGIAALGQLQTRGWGTARSGMG